ncbi:MAG: Fic family protein [bacterium]|nr:Fic family protein [bacterium]
MKKLNQRQQRILGLFLKGEKFSSSALYAQLRREEEKLSLITVKRALAELSELGLLSVHGLGRATSYGVSVHGRIYANVDAHTYCAVEPDKRYGSSRFNFDLFSQFPADIFLESEQSVLDEATAHYKKHTADLSDTIQKKELERLVIELSWKSSKIEGNTYTLLDTEKLIMEHKEAPGHSKNEARMILNHKDAFTFIHEHANSFKVLSRANLEQLHTLLVKDMGVGLGLRKKPVGVLGSTYRPLDNVHQITDAIAGLSRAISSADTPYTKALVALSGISYIQPFEDGNKRTSRLMGNALLMAYGCAPLSYRSVDENAYREAMLVFYELNSIVPLKAIFIGQYVFAAKNYAVKSS